MAFEIAAAVSTLKALAGVAKEAGKIDLYQQVLDLQQVLLEATSENLRVVAENYSLHERVRSLEARLAGMKAAAELEYDGYVYWSGDHDDPQHGPFCPKCKDTHDRLARMSDRGNGFTVCSSCSFSVQNQNIDATGRSARRRSPRTW